MSARGISDLERGARSHPHQETVRLLADALGLSGTARSTFARAAPRTIGHTAARPERVAVPLPRPLTPLIGRTQERAMLTSLLQEDVVRLVTLTGPGGVGKTRLALAVAEQVSEAFPDGRIFVDLAPLQDPALVLAHVAAMLGVRESAGRALIAAMHDVLRERDVLLVLDNVEHLLPAAPVVLDLLAAGPRMKVLATSRAPLRVRGEREYPVPVLRLPTPEDARDVTVLAMNEAVAFFIDRVQAGKPDFALTVDNAAAVVDICQRLDGLPLALELAAARTKILAVQTLRTRLDQRLPLLTGGTRDAPARQRTLHDTIAWSYDLLRAEDRCLFDRLGVFVGGWTLEAAETVVNLEGNRDVLAGLAALADLSLIRLDESGAEPRYGMLETIREFAQDRLAASGDEAALRQTHAAYFLSLAEHGKPELYGPRQGTWLRLLEAERPNFRVALATLATSDDHDTHLRLAAALGDFWFLRGHLTDGRSHLERALARAEAPSPSRAEALRGLGVLAYAQSDFAAAETWLRQSEALAEALNVPTLLWHAPFERGFAAQLEGDVERAASRFEAALAAAREHNDAFGAGIALSALGYMAHQRGDLDAAERLSAEAIGLLRTVGAAFELCFGLRLIGEIALARDDLARAIAAYQEALDLALDIEVELAVASALAGFAAVAAARGDHTSAAQVLGATETVREDSHHVRLMNPVQHAQTIQTVRTALGETAFVAAWEAGRALPVQDAVELPRSLGLLEGNAG
jgi:predicted ATPase